MSKQVIDSQNDKEIGKILKENGFKLCTSKLVKIYLLNKKVN